MTASVPGERFAVVVVIHDSARELERLLQSIDAHLSPRPQVVVVDNASTDGGGELAHEHGAEVVALGANIGFGAANNAGVGRVNAGVTALLNPDIELLDAGLAQLVARAATRDVLIAPRLLNEDGTVQHSAHPLPGTVEALLPALVAPQLLPPALRVRADPWRALQPRPIGWAIAACLVARTQTLARLGPFDEHAFLFFEDLELCLRARAAGVAVELHPDVRLRHTGGHATERFYGGEPHDAIARRRRHVVAAILGPRALALDDAAQALTFASRALARPLARRDARRPRAQLRALLAARHASRRA